MEIILHSHENKTHFHKKGCALSLILKVRVFGTRKWPIIAFPLPQAINKKNHSHIKTLKDTMFINSNLCAVLCNKFILSHFSLTC